MKITNYQPTHESGQIVDAFDGFVRINRKTEVRLIDFKDFHRRTDGKVDKRYGSQRNSNGDVFIKEIWLAQEISTGKVADFYVLQEVDFAVRPQRINDNHVDYQVDSEIYQPDNSCYDAHCVYTLIDSYEECLTGERDFVKPCPIQQVQNDRHQYRIALMERILKGNIPNAIRQGLSLFLMHAQTPTVETLKAKNILKTDYLEVYEQIRCVIYESFYTANSYIPVYQGKQPDWVTERNLYPTPRSPRYELCSQ